MEDVPVWVPEQGSVALVSGPGTDATGTLWDVMYQTSAGGSSGNGSLILLAWCSMAFAPALGDLGSFLICNGGDGDYWGNEVYRWDISTRTWSRLGTRSALSGVPGTDPGIDRTWGEHQDQSPTRVQPSVPHNTDAVLCLPATEGGGAYGALLFPSRSFCYTTDRYKHPHFFKPDLETWHRGSSSPAILDWNTNIENTSWIRDDTRGKYWGIAVGQGQIFGSKIMSLTFNGSGIATAGADNFIDTSKLVPSGYAVSRHWPTQDWFLSIGMDHNYALATTAVLKAIDLNNPTGGLIELTLTGDTVPLSYGYGLAYVPDLDCFFVRPGMGDRQALWKLTPPVGSPIGVWTVTKITMAGDAVESLENFQGVYKRFEYVDALRSLVWCDNYQGGWYVYRPVGV